MSYISVNLYRKLINCAFAEGLSPDELKDLGTPISMIEEVQAVPADHFFELHEILDQKLDPGFSIRAGLEMKIEDYGVLGLSWRTCSSAGEIFERSERYFKLLSDTYLFKVEKRDEVSDIYLHRDAYRFGLERSNESTFSATIVVIQAMTETEITPVNVSFKHSIHHSPSIYQDAFGCQVLFDKPDNIITYNTADLETRTAKADSSINKFLVERVQEELEGIQISPAKIVTDVENLIKDSLPSGIPGIVKICDHMGMSNRTLTRRLSESGISYRDLIKKVQIDISTELLKSTSQSIGEIAFLTGFSEQSAFNRAFRRWTGKSPIEFRKSRQKINLA